MLKKINRNNRKQQIDGNEHDCDANYLRIKQKKRGKNQLWIGSVCAPMWVLLEYWYTNQMKSKWFDCVLVKATNIRPWLIIHCVTFLSRDLFLCWMSTLFLCIQHTHTQTHIDVCVSSFFVKVSNFIIQTSTIIMHQWPMNNEHYSKKYHFIFTLSWAKDSHTYTA